MQLSAGGGSNAVLKEPALCSKIFLFNGLCGHPNYGYPGWPDVAIAVGAWEKAPIRILAVSADAIVSTRWRAITASIFAGNSFNNDPMTPLRYATGQLVGLFGAVHAILHTEQHFPADNGMQFPAGQPMPQTHLDVHVSCDPAGAHYSGNLSVWYVFDRQ